VALHPLQLLVPAAAFTVSPPLPLLRNPHADISLFTFLLLHAGHSGRSFDPKTRYSNLLSHFSQ
jgi:hypothetical protein